MIARASLILLLTLVSCTRTSSFEEEVLGQMTGRVFGCSDFEIAVGNESNDEFVRIWGVTDKLLPSEDVVVFNIAKTPDLNVRYDRFVKTDPDLEEFYLPYCNDALMLDPGHVTERWTPVSGQLIMSRTEIVPEPIGSRYTISFSLENAVFTRGSEQIHIELLRLNSVDVGWYPG